MWLTASLFSIKRNLSKKSDMNLTTYQGKIASYMLENKDKNLSLLDRIKIHALARRNILIICCCLGSAFCWYALELYALSHIFVGIIVGFLFNELGWILNANRLQPLMKEIIDWEKVKNLLS